MQDATATHKPRANQPTWLTILRIALGIILIWKGINFIRDISVLKSMIEQTGVGVFSRSSGAIAAIVGILSLLCGVFITVGFFTRISSVVMIPIIFVAIVFVNMKNIERNAFELTLTIIVLVLLVLFAIKGSGPLSADEYFRRGAALDKRRDAAIDKRT
jgi:putative oxidoreductase